MTAENQSDLLNSQPNLMNGDIIPFRAWATGLYLILNLTVFCLISIFQKGSAFLDVLDRPYTSFNRIFENDVLMSDFRNIHNLSWYDKLYRFVETDITHALNEGIKSAEEFIKQIEKERLERSVTISHLRVKLAVFYAEAGRVSKFLLHARELEENPELLQVLFKAYFNSDLENNPLYDSKINKYIGGRPSFMWSFGRLRAAYLKNEGRTEDSDFQNLVLEKKGKALRLRYAFIWACSMFLLITGLILTVLCLFRRFKLFPIRKALIPLPVSTKVLLGILARSSFWGILIMYGSQFIPVKFIRDISFLTLSLLSALPMFYYVQRYLLSRYSLSWTETFGLSLKTSDILKMFAMGLFLAFLDQVGSALINSFFENAGRALHWSETVDETLLFGKGWEAGLDFFDSSVSAPLVEEIACRGLLYAALRRHLNVATSVLISGILFSAIHFYSLAGFFEVLWSGVVWAYGYERTRSLWPGIMSHGINNFLICLSSVLLYR